MRGNERESVYVCCVVKKDKQLRERKMRGKVEKKGPPAQKGKKSKEGRKKEGRERESSEQKRVVVTGKVGAFLLFSSLSFSNNFFLNI